MGNASYKTGLIFEEHDLQDNRKPKAAVIKRFVVRHKSGNFYSQLVFNRQQNFRLRSHDKLIHYTDNSFKITLQHTDKFDCRMQLFSHYCAMFKRI